MKEHTSPESGSVIILIFVAIAAFAALSFTVAQMIQSGNPEGFSSEKAKLAASEIIAFGQTVRQGVHSIRISNECTDTDISFEATGLAGYAHTPPAQDGCKVFSLSGAGITYINPAQAYNGAVTSATWVFSGEHPIEQIGTAAADLVMMANVKQIACIEINKMQDVALVSGDAPADTGGAFPVFTGSYGAGAVIGDESSNLEGHTTGCYLDTAAGEYRFYQVLIGR